MFPIRDHNPTSRFPIVTFGLIAINVIVFISYLPILGNEQAVSRFFSHWAMIPARVTETGAYYTILTSMFLHAGFAHILGNMLFLWIFGDNMEDQFGHVGFLLFYLACGMGAGLTHILFAPHSTVPTVGASGAIAGVMGGYLLLFPRARVDILIFFVVFVQVMTLPAWTMLGFWFAMQFISGVGADASTGGVAYWAHTGGFVVGFLLTLPIWLRRGNTGFWQGTQGRPPHPETRYRVRKTDVPRIRRRK